MQSKIEFIRSENSNVYLFKITRDASTNFENIKEDVCTVIMDGEYIHSQECKFGVLSHKETMIIRELLSTVI